MASGWNGPLEIARWEVEQRSAFVGAIFYLNILAWVMRMFWFSNFLNELKSTADSEHLRGDSYVTRVPGFPTTTS